MHICQQIYIISLKMITVFVIEQPYEMSQLFVCINFLYLVFNTLYLIRIHIGNDLIDIDMCQSD